MSRILSYTHTFLYYLFFLVQLSLRDVGGRVLKGSSKGLSQISYLLTRAHVFHRLPPTPGSGKGGFSIVCPPPLEVEKGWVCLEMLTKVA